MTNREIDLLVIGFSVGSLVNLWLGYRLRVRVERWQAGRAKRWRRRAKTTPFPSPGYDAIPFCLDTRVVLKKPRHVPLARRDLNTERTTPSHTDFQRIPITCNSSMAAETTHLIREDALAALTGAGYKRAAAEAALDACTMVERAGGLESWVAAALRRAASTK